MIEQIVIGICGASSIWLSQSANPKTQRYACIFGLSAQPFWFYATYHAQQWGMLALCIFYAIAWARGIFNHWIKPAKCGGGSE